ncbi:glycosyltransferase family 32 protein [Brucella pituitosa]|uniref:glycosyltransferase family 32 protein n=1 Tax=Brucella pituitosa TaxID=571256 RepID=UPI000CFF5526|nr:hypothetical protein CQ062_20075 [Ochrobactrum sp. MYb68]
MSLFEVYSIGFEEDHRLRSILVREVMLRQLGEATSRTLPSVTVIAKNLVRYWDDHTEIPQDVKVCLDSWSPLLDEGFSLLLFDKQSALDYIADKFTNKEVEAFARCRHPAMQSDFFRMCYLLIEGGLYVDADDILLGDGWKRIFGNGRLKLQPLCYDTLTSRMVPVLDFLTAGRSSDQQIFYVNNDPIAAPAGHPILAKALARSTARLLGDDHLPQIQETTGPGNITAVLASHACELIAKGKEIDFDLLFDWDSIAEMRWDLSYRSDARNWRNVDGSGF